MNLNKVFILGNLTRDPELDLGDEFTVETEWFGVYTAMLDVVNGFVMIVSLEIGDDYIIMQLIRMGFDEQERFVFDHIIIGVPGSPEEEMEYNYSGFVESERFLLINDFGDGEFDFGMVSDADDEILSVSVRNGGGEGAEEAERTEFVRWHDADTDRRTSILFADDEVATEFYEFFNVQGIWFGYEAPLLGNPDLVGVRWNLLEATGWDYVYDDPSNDSYTMYVDLYKDDVMMFADGSAKVRGYLTFFALLTLEVEAEPGYFTQDVLDLTAFGMQFDHPELTPEMLDAVIAHDRAAAAEKAIYMEIDLLGDVTRDDLASLIPTDLFDYLDE